MTEIIIPSQSLDMVAGSETVKYGAYFDRYLNPRTRKIYLNDVVSFFDGEIPTTVIELRERATTDAVLRWRTTLYQEGNKAVTVNRKLSAVRTFFDYAVAIGWLYRNPAHAKLVAPLKVADWEPEISLSLKDVKAMLERCYQDVQRKRGMRDRAIIALGFTSILRRSEIIGLSWSDIVSVGRGQYMLRLRHAKGGDGETVPLNAMTKQLIEEYLVELGSPEQLKEDINGMPIFVSLSKRTFGRRLNDNTIGKIIKRRAGQAGLPSEMIHAHLLRHAGVTHLLENGEDLAKVQVFARHKNPQTTMVYNRAIEKFRHSAADRLARDVFGV